MIEYNNPSDNPGISPDMYNPANAKQAAYAIAKRNFERGQEIVKNYLEEIRQVYQQVVQNYGSDNIKSSYQFS